MIPYNSNWNDDSAHATAHSIRDANKIGESTMKFNQFSYIPTANDTMKEELALLGFNFQEESDPKKMLGAFVRQVSFQYKDTDYALSTLVADKELRKTLNSRCFLYSCLSITRL